MSKTPETDAVAGIEGNWDTKALCMGDFARKLERERDAYENALRRIYDLSIDGDEIWSDIEQISAIAHNALNHHE